MLNIIMKQAEIERAAKEVGFPKERVLPLIKPAVLLRLSEQSTGAGDSKLGGLPDLPEDVDWPRWDGSAYNAKELATAEEYLAKSGHDSWKQRIEELNSGSKNVPLSFIAQLNLSDLAGLDHGLPLPESGILFFFYELCEQPWGYCPSHRGGFQVVHAPAGVQLEPRSPPSDLATDMELGPGRRVTPTNVLTLPSWSDFDDDELNDHYDELQDALSGSAASMIGHQVGGHPDQIQGDMARQCALVTQGVFSGSPPDPSEQIEQMAKRASEWHLLLQITSDEELDWSWGGNDGNFYWWMREEDIRLGRWGEAWFCFQTT